MRFVLHRVKQILKAFLPSSYLDNLIWMVCSLFFPPQYIPTCLFYLVHHSFITVSVSTEMTNVNLWYPAPIVILIFLSLCGLSWPCWQIIPVMNVKITQPDRGLVVTSHIVQFAQCNFLSTMVLSTLCIKCHFCLLKLVIFTK